MSLELLATAVETDAASPILDGLGEEGFRNLPKPKPKPKLVPKPKVVPKPGPSGSWLGP